MDATLHGYTLTEKGLAAVIEKAKELDLGKVVSFEVPHCLMIAAHMLLDFKWMKYPQEVVAVLMGLGFLPNVIQIREHPGVAIDENWRVIFERGTINNIH